MLKATGGGGGIGMTVCSTEQEVADAFERVGRLAASNFAASGVFLERLVRPARHVEVQIIGDGAGRVAVLGDRDCSLQRRNQKVVEEAPAPQPVRRAAPEPARLGGRPGGIGELPVRRHRRVRLRPHPRSGLLSWRSTPASRWSIR
jgi:hypothetical protein